jgi:hypothetical protein
VEEVAAPLTGQKPLHARGLLLQRASRRLTITAVLRNAKLAKYFVREARQSRTTI